MRLQAIGIVVAIIICSLSLGVCAKDAALVGGEKELVIIGTSDGNVPVFMTPEERERYHPSVFKIETENGLITVNGRITGLDLTLFDAAAVAARLQDLPALPTLKKEDVTG